MAYQALYRKWRPMVFDDVVGQPHITQTLKNEIIADRTVHAYLFCGTRGTGKTSAARILSRAINCEQPSQGNPCNQCAACRGIIDGGIMDVAEIDAASNNGVDNIRDIREEARYGASIARYKVYIIDEVHMLSSGAFNALLKLLEEPPAHVKFILATTELHKVPATILSRCQRFDFKRIGAVDIAGRLRDALSADGVRFDEEALSLIARLGDGSMRDALSILDQCLAFSGEYLDYKEVVEFLGITEQGFMADLAHCIANEDIGGAITLVNQYAEQGRNITALVESFVNFARDLILCKALSAPEEMLEASPEQVKEMRECASKFSCEKLVHCVNMGNEAANAARFMSNARVLFELAVVKMCRPAFDSSPDAYAARLAELERRLEQGAFVQNAPAPPPQSPQPKPAPKTPKPSPPPEKAPPEASKLVKLVKDRWQEVLKELDKRGLVTLYTALVTAELRQEDGQLIIMHAKRSHELFAALVKSCMEDLAEVLKAVAGGCPKLAFRPVNDPLERDFLEDLHDIDSVTGV